MINVKIIVSETEVKKRLGALANQSGKVIARAANRSLVTGKKVIRQETTKVYDVLQKDVESCLRVRKATYSHPMITLTYADNHKNLYYFGRKSTVSPRFVITSSDPVNPDPEYVSARVMKKHSRIALNKSPKPFVQQTKSGNIALFQRTSNDSRAPIRGVGAPAMPQIVKNPEVLARFRRDAGQMFQKRLEYEIDRVLKGH